LEASVLKPGVAAVFDDVNKGFYVIADVEGTIAGGLLVTFEWSDWRNKWFWWIQSVYVLPDNRGQSVYRRMYEFVKELAKEQGDVCGFRLYVEKENEDAQKVYQKLGMHQSHYLAFEEEK
ncbi:MAG: GNAT family N-acetyltransferase, partial [Acidobacteriota bacterium]